MGGAATKHLNTRRMTDDEFKKISSYINECIASESILFRLLHFKIARSYAKDSHGDIDLIICDLKAREIFVNKLEEFFTDVEKSNLSQGLVECYACTHDGVRFQLDIITGNEFALRWYDYGNMSLLIGRVIPFKFKFGYDGLCLRGSPMDRIPDALIIKDFDKALEFLGFDFGRFEKGFKTREDMLDWIADSKYFRVNSFDNDQRSNRVKRRDRDRTTLDDDIAYLKEKPEQGNMPLSDYNKFAHIDIKNIKDSITKKIFAAKLRKIQFRYLLSVEQMDYARGQDIETKRFCSDMNTMDMAIYIFGTEIVYNRENFLNHLRDYSKSILEDKYVEEINWWRKVVSATLTIYSMRLNRAMRDFMEMFVYAHTLHYFDKQVFSVQNLIKMGMSPLAIKYLANDNITDALLDISLKLK